MIKKYMNQLYKEVIQIQRKIDGGHLVCFGHHKFGDAQDYYVILKDGSYFYINIGSKYIPKIRKKDVAFIGKQITCDSLDERWGKYVDYVDSDRGRTRYAWLESVRGISSYKETVHKKYNEDPFKEIDTGYWD